MNQEIVITGIGVASPVGVGREAFWASLTRGVGGVRALDMFSDDVPVAPFGGMVADFDPKKFVRPRKSLKVMSRDIQLGFAAADLACEDAGLHQCPADPEQLGIVFGADMIHCDLSELIEAYQDCVVDGKFDFDRWGPAAAAELYPLWMLKYLPNMPACHIGISQDARGPNNSLTLGDVSSLSAVAEAARVLQRGHAEVMIAGGTGSRIHPVSWIRTRVLDGSHRDDDPATVCRPFDARRDGMVNGEGAGAFILETRRHAEARGARIHAKLLAFASTFEPCSKGKPPQGSAIRKAIAGALQASGLEAADVGHVNANGISTVLDDRIEAQAVRDILGDVPVTAPKSFFGNLGAGSGAVEMAAAVLALGEGLVPRTLNYEHPDPQCPVNVVHGDSLQGTKPTAMVLNHTPFGQAVAMLLSTP